MISPTTDSVAGRISWLMQKLWRGSQIEMARDTGIPQGTLSSILRGKREPGAKVIHAIAAHPLVNLEWLRTGAGDPLANSTIGSKGIMPRVFIDGVEYVPRVQIPPLTDERLKAALQSLTEIQYFASEKHKHRAWAWDALNALAPELAELAAVNPTAAFDRLHKE